MIAEISNCRSQSRRILEDKLFFVKKGIIWTSNFVATIFFQKELEMEKTARIKHPLNKFFQCNLKLLLFLYFCKFFSLMNDDFWSMKDALFSPTLKIRFNGRDWVIYFLWLTVLIFATQYIWESCNVLVRLVWKAEIQPKQFLSSIFHYKICLSYVVKVSQHFIAY